jgi:hypothetical protein
MASFQFTPGYFLVIDSSHAGGGVSYDRDVISEREVGDGIEKEYKTTKRVDNAKLVAESDSIVSKVRYACRKNCSKTAIGWIANADQLRALQTVLRELEREVVAFNKKAELSGSCRRVALTVVPFEITVDNEAAARAIADSIRNTLGTIVRKIEAGEEAKKIRQYVTNHARNIEKLAIGMQRFALIDAMESIDKSLTDLAKAQKEGSEFAAQLDEVHSAIGLFVDLDADHSSELVAAASV